MGMLIEGRWTSDDLRRTNGNGEFIRTRSSFREVIGDGNPRFPAEAGRYHLFVNAGCPWAYRAILYRSLKGLTDSIGITFTQPAAGPEGWTFGEVAEPLLGAQHLHEIYSRADPAFTGRVTVPVLWDKAGETIVNNESADIIRLLDSAFDTLPGVSRTTFYPTDLAAEIDSLNGIIYTNINNGVYRCGFAQSQSAYEAAYDALFNTLDDLDRRLSTHRYLCGSRITEADWRLFSTLVRFDIAYYGHFLCNRNRLVDFRNLWPYTRDLYQYPEVAETVDVNAIKGIYYGSRPPFLLPKGPEIDFSIPHGRA
ncbi:MAG: glutathione S-transferase C-terminal domain-containing protein [Pseudomonadales bacterium]|nr:glutathione S-transferase C-terminal domain-containing protein [Pseudomonadales bacterium]